MPFIIEEQQNPQPQSFRRRSFGASRPGALESLIYANGLMLNDQIRGERYFIKSVDGLWGADIRDQREPKVNDDGEDVYDTLLSGKTVTISGRIEAMSLDSMRDMEQDLEQAFPHNFDYPIVFDRSQLRTAGINQGALIDSNQCTNPSFGKDTFGYTAGAGITATRQTDFYRSRTGDYYLTVTYNGVASGGVTYDSQTSGGVFNAKQGQYVQVGVDVFLPEGWNDNDVHIDITPKSATSDGTAYSLVPTLSDSVVDTTVTNRWQRIWITKKWNNVEDANRIQVFVGSSGVPANTNNFYIRGVHVRASGVVQSVSFEPAFYDGNSSGWVWTGEPHNSNSVPDPVAYRQNVFIMGRRVDKLGFRDEQTNRWFNRDFQIPLRLADPRIYSVNTKTVSSVPGALTTLYAKNHGNYMASPRLHIIGPWTNLAIVNTVLLDGEITQRRFSFTGSIPAGGYFDWNEQNNSLIDNTGVRKDGMVDAAANGLRLIDSGTSILTLAGTGLTGASQVFMSYEDTWK